MEAVESEPRTRGERGLILYASVSAVPFYEAAGGAPFASTTTGTPG